MASAAESVTNAKGKRKDPGVARKKKDNAQPKGKRAGGKGVERKKKAKVQAKGKGAEVERKEEGNALGKVNGVRIQRKKKSKATGTVSPCVCACPLNVRFSAGPKVFVKLIQRFFKATNSFAYDRQKEDATAQQKESHR